jgi:tetratricopeptide (TPR) repeat protein
LLRRIWQIFGFVVLGFSFLLSQPSGVIDSLTKIINQPSTPDSTKIKLYGDISWNLIGTDINRSLEFAKKELELSIRTGRKADIAQSYSDLGSIYNRRGEFDTALVHYYKALKIRTELNHDKKVAGVYCNIASVYFRQSKYR